MRLLLNKAIIALSSGLVLFTAPIALSELVRTPLSSTIEVRGSSGGTQTNNSCRGFMFSSTPAQTIEVTEASTPLEFSVAGSGQVALLITGTGNPLCIPSSQPGGTIVVPGVWQRGTYSVFVGDRSEIGSSFTLSINQGN